MPFKRVASLDDLWDGEMKGIRLDGKKLLLIRLEDRVYAYEDRCAHQAVELSKGRLKGCVLTCFAHEWQYDARTGRGINPAGACLKGFETRVEGEDILVDLSAPPPTACYTGALE